MNVLVVGGAGYIGSHAVRYLARAKHRVIVVDNLSHGHLESIEGASTGNDEKPKFIEADILDRPAMVKILKSNAIEVVLHFAAFIEVGESVENPFKYYWNNVAGSLSLMDAMREAGVKKLVFSSTAAVYGNPLVTPITEDHPLNPINPYGRSKMMVEMAIEDFSRAYGMGYAVLRYFNVAGADPDGVIGEAHEPESHLIPRVLDAASGQGKIGIFGDDYETADGTCIRDYVHVEDLVRAHALAMEVIEPGRGKVYNLGSENGFSVRQVIQACEKVTGNKIPTEQKQRRAGDPAILVASSERIRSELGWQPRYERLETIVDHAWKWHQRPRSHAPLDRS